MAQQGLRCVIIECQNLLICLRKLVRHIFHQTVRWKSIKIYVVEEFLQNLSTNTRKTICFSKKTIDRVTYFCRIVIQNFHDSLEMSDIFKIENSRAISMVEIITRNIMSTFHFK